MRCVDDFVAYVTERGNFIDYQLAITTTTVDYTGAGASDALEPGEAGLLTGTPTVPGRDNPDIADASKKIFCVTPRIGTVQNCLHRKIRIPITIVKPVAILKSFPCRFRLPLWYHGWDNPSGSGQEEPLEAALMAFVEPRRTHQMR